MDLFLGPWPDPAEAVIAAAAYHAWTGDPARLTNLHDGRTALVLHRGYFPGTDTPAGIGGHTPAPWTRYSLERRFRWSNGWSHTGGAATRAGIEALLEQERDHLEPYEYDGRHYAYRIIDNESWSIVQ